ncbi:polysaccharide biosynthesis tyrosine autokinase [Winogradskya consettensis]|uniref:non-specific protein-tyrosine kinase n=2 Tax=Winogradskya consettensis TaxID=113560 RepID=A0A919SGA2_9ACTN|nr:chromosome partitioning protein [Actinoplanes consettensis]
MGDMELRDYIRVARKRWWMVVTAVAVALALGTLLTVQAVPRYATSVTFFVTTPSAGVSDAYQGGLFSQERVKSYSTLLSGDRIAQLVAGSPGIDLDATEVRARITAQAVPETVLLQATVTDSSKDRSRLIAAATAERFKTLVESLETPPGKKVSSVKVEVVAGPETADTPVSPRPLRNLALAAVLGLIVGAAAAVLREVLDTTIKTAEALQELASAPVLAGVPFDNDAKGGPMTLTGGGHSARAEALRQLRTNLQYVDVDRPVKTLVVTSAVPGEGKSSTACGVAMLFAEAGHRVLIVDADLRRPRIADYLGLEGAAGLTTVLAGKASVDDVLQRYGNHLWVLPSGFLPPNPSELLGSQHMATLMDELREVFDTIIIDCPPLLPVTDAAVVAARADGALLLARSRRTTSAQVTGAVKALKSVDARLLGCVLNMVAAKGPDAYYYYDEYSAKGHSAGRRASGRREAIGVVPDVMAARDVPAADAVSAPPVGSVR